MGTCIFRNIEGFLFWWERNVWMIEIMHKLEEKTMCSWMIVFCSSLSIVIDFWFCRLCFSMVIYMMVYELLNNHSQHCHEGIICIVEIHLCGYIHLQKYWRLCFLVRNKCVNDWNNAWTEQKTICSWMSESSCLSFKPLLLACNTHPLILKW